MMVNGTHIGLIWHVIVQAGLLLSLPASMLFAGDTDPNLIIRLNAKLMAQARKDRISSLPTERQQRQQQDLQALIQRIRTLRIIKAKAAVERAVAEANSLEVVASVAQAPVEPNHTRTVVVNGIDPNMVADPFKMAEILSATGHNRQAVPFYQKALVLLGKDDPNTAASRQWILLQLGRCLLEDQPVLARQAFSQLISEYPESPWIPLARAMLSLAEWYIADKPLQVIRQTNVISGNVAGQQR